jgi:hypothetical protein
MSTNSRNVTEQKHWYNTFTFRGGAGIYWRIQRLWETKSRMNFKDKLAKEIKVSNSNSGSPNQYLITKLRKGGYRSICQKTLCQK